MTAMGSVSVYADAVSTFPARCDRLGICVSAGSKMALELCAAMCYPMHI
jgi:hypothetical protein